RRRARRAGLPSTPLHAGPTAEAPYRVVACPKVAPSPSALDEEDQEDAGHDESNGGRVTEEMQRFGNRLHPHDDVRARPAVAHLERLAVSDPCWHGDLNPAAFRQLAGASARLAWVCDQAPSARTLAAGLDLEHAVARQRRALPEPAAPSAAGARPRRPGGRGAASGARLARDVGLVLERLRRPTLGLELGDAEVADVDAARGRAAEEIVEERRRPCLDVSERPAAAIAEAVVEEPRVRLREHLVGLGQLDELLVR